ncbi:NAD-dependent epimerase/dehydratase family protein [Altererythrobacter sp. TH136]|uniref:NAD-dependent epimerase/dehydratase family protein n=1 Tax=Altererythrobacter sp. TH136 TaxID=2067415 RepID=UPI0011625745|nr:NAD-dependent epimerase/dehydratase family protein [Altererythrobacter sp. TH136]QDM41997.1 NAD-dependent epimerase/dehydratase family protein [Altererythrobacter sp. TH136]
MRTVLVTGSAGFIGFHLSQLLLDEGFRVVGFDAMTDYYDVRLKERRHQMLLQNQHFTANVGLLENFKQLNALVMSEKPDVIVHLAAQAGVRYSIENPRAYIDANIIGTFNLMECARELGVDHLLMASTSSVYGANEDMPFDERQKADTQLTLYAATKKATESMGHSYAHLWNLPVTMFRFFTVYGAWGRPDMALFKFTKGILEGTPIDIYNHGKMFRDFTYVTDLVRGIRGLIDAVPVRPESAEAIPAWDSLSPAAPFRVVNIGNNNKVRLEDFVDAIEAECGKPAIRNYMDLQQGDVPATWADATLLENLTGYRPQTDVREGIRRFVAWYRDYYAV